MATPVQQPPKKQKIHRTRGQMIVDDLQKVTRNLKVAYINDNDNSSAIMALIDASEKLQSAVKEHFKL